MRLLLTGALSLGLGQFAAAADFSVNTTADEVDATPGDGVCASAEGACSVRAAIIETNALEGGDVISIPAGTYVLTIPGVDEDASATGDLDIRDDLTLEGAGSLLTILDGGGLDFVVSASGPRVALRSLTIRGGLGAGVSLDDPSSSSLSTEISDAIIENNDGDGIFGMTRGLEISRTAIRQNQGAGVYVGFVSQPTLIEDSSIVENHGVAGGGLWLGYGYGEALVRRSVVSSNSPGGIAVTEKSLIVEDSLIQWNTDGPGIELGLETGAARIVRTVVEGNEGSSAGGIFLEFSYGYDGAVLIQDSAIIGNVSSGGAGGVQASKAVSLHVINTTLSGNTGLTGGGIALRGSYDNPLLLQNCTVTDNTASVGGGIALIGNDSAPSWAVATLVNTIVAGNSASSSAPDCSRVGSSEVYFVSLGHNLIGDVTDCDFTAGPGDLIGIAPAVIDPLLGPLEPNEIPTPVHHPEPGSPAIDAGDDFACTTADQRGEPRPLDGNGDGIAQCDIGAVEATSGDSDLDTHADRVDNCPTVANATQSDVDADGVGDACDNCTNVANPQVSIAFRRAGYTWTIQNPWATLTGGQRDDDRDGFGNACDAKFVGLATRAVGALDLAQFRASSGQPIESDTCGTTHTMPCAIFDLDEQPGIIGALDLIFFRALSGSRPGPTCATCPRTCTAGPQGSCF